MEAKHPWIARISVAFIMLALAFVGMVFTDIHTTAGWDYWKWVVPIYALLALWLSWYVKKKMETIMPITLWHELLHWLALVASVFLVSYLTDLGVIGRFAAGLFDLLLLSLAVFIAGIYIETTFIFIGLMLGAFAVLVGVFIEYFYAILIPVVIGAGLIVALSVWLSHRKFTRPNKED